MSDKNKMYITEFIFCLQSSSRVPAFNLSFDCCLSGVPVHVHCVCMAYFLAFWFFPPPKKLKKMELAKMECRWVWMSVLLCVHMMLRDRLINWHPHLGCIPASCSWDMVQIHCSVSLWWLNRTYTHSVCAGSDTESNNLDDDYIKRITNPYWMR